MIERDVDIGPCTLRVRVRGSGPAIVFGHSLGFDGEMWQAQVDALAGRFRTVAIDTRGHGASGHTDELTLEDCADDVARVMDELGIARAGYCGLSLGGMIGMRLALRHPRRVAALVLMNTSAEPEDPARRAAYEMFNEHARGKRPDAQGTAMVMGLMFSPRFIAENPGIAARYEARLAAHPADDGRYVATRAVLSRGDLLAQLRSIDTPTVVIASRDDRALPPVHGARIAEAIPGARLEILDGGHMSAVEQPAAVTLILAEHFERHLGGSR